VVAQTPGTGRIGPRTCLLLAWWRRFFGALDEAVLPISFCLGLKCGHAHDSGARKRRMSARMARTIGPVTATSANWKVMARA